MKRITIILICQSFSVMILACGMQSGYAEMFYKIDSVNPNIIHITLKSTDTWYCPGQDSAILYTYLGSTRIRKAIPLIDTFNVEEGYILKTYKGDYIVDSLNPDSVVTFICYISNYTHLTINSAHGSMISEMEINYKGGALVGTSSPQFNGTRITYGVGGEILTYDPLLFKSVEDSIFVSLQPVPFTGWYQFPYEVEKGAHPSDTILVNDTTGVLTWLYPRDEGYYDILYKATQYRNGHCMGYIMRNMLIYISRDTTTTTLKDLSSSTVSLHCYPSPTSGSFTIDMSAYDASEKQIHIYDQLGQIVYQTATVDSKLEVDKALASGIYTIEVIQDSRREYARLVRE